MMTRIKLKTASPIQRCKIYKKYGMKIGDNCSIGVDVHFGSESYLVTIGNNVRITEKVRFITHDGGLWVVRNLYPEYKDMDLIKPIKVGDNVHIGIGAVIMPGVHIGNNCIIGCGAIVTKDIPDNSIAVGVPARVIENIDDYVEKNRNDFIMTKQLSKEEKKKITQELNNVR
jgi:acetyltransferase-like isoleucine patch superfamily enzyme